MMSLGAWLWMGLGVNACKQPDPNQREAVVQPLLAPPQAARVAGASNVRVLPALATSSGHRLRGGILFRSGHLALVNEEGQADLHALGIRLIVDCRSKAEASELPDAPWVISGARHVSLDLPKPTADHAASCSEALAATEAKLATLFSYLGQPTSLPALFHCGAGRERSCLVMTVLLLALGVPPESAAEDFAKNQLVPADPRWLDPLFARVAHQGGIDRYLAAHSVARADLESFRQRAIE
jgi:hypothetical protein